MLGLLGQAEVELALLEFEDEAVEVVLEVLDLVHPAGVEVAVLHDLPGLAEELVGELLLGVADVAGRGLREELVELLLELLVPGLDFKLNYILRNVHQ